MTEDRSTPDTDTVTPASPAAEKPPRPRGAGLALLLALLALAGTGGAGFYAWQQQQALTTRIAGLEQGLHEQLAQRASLDALGLLRKELDSLRQSLEAQQQHLDALRAELATQQQALDALRTLTGRDERLWRLGEIERLLTAAQTRLRLLDDAATARLLLQEADRTAAPLGGEALPLREAMQQAASAIHGTPLDREGLALRLTQLAEILPDLPRIKPAAEQVENAPTEGWWPRAKAWVSGWLHIERKGAPAAERDQALLEAANALLQARRLLLARDTAQALERVRQAAEAARAHLDGHDTRALAALDELNDLSATLAQPAPTMVDLTPAFTALRALRATGPSTIPQGD
jgi:uncharacterized protein HemX